MDEWNVVSSENVVLASKLRRIENKVEGLEQKVDKIIEMLSTVEEYQARDRSIYSRNHHEYLSYLKDIRGITLDNNISSIVGQSGKEKLRKTSLFTNILF